MYTMLAVFLGGGLGSLARYGTAILVARFFNSSFPLGTLLANVLSCVVMAVAIIWLGTRFQESSEARLFLLVGFCGGFSTFSTFSFETWELFRNGNPGFALANILVSVLACTLIFFVLAKNHQA